MNFISEIRKLWLLESYQRSCSKTIEKPNYEISLAEGENEANTEENNLSELKSIRNKNINRVIIAHLNINSIRNKIDMLTNNVSGNIDILMLSETKIDNSFPTQQFKINGFSNPYRIDRSCHGGGILLYVREGIISKCLKSVEIPNNLECVFIEINLGKKK